MATLFTLVSIAATLLGARLLHMKWFKPSRTSAKYKRRVALIIYFVALLQGAYLVWTHWRNSRQEVNNNQLKTELKVLRTEIKGMLDGGASYAEFGFMPSMAKTNSLDVVMTVRGQYPLRNLGVKIINETKRINTGLAKSGEVAPSEPLLERFWGDIAVNGMTELPSITLDPEATNHFRFDVSAMNGFSWEIFDFWKITNNWGIRLAYRHRRVGDKLTIEPTNFAHALLVY
jgi:hypothetical protein